MPRKSKVVPVSRLETLQTVTRQLLHEFEEGRSCKRCTGAMVDPPSVSAGLSKELRAVLAEIEQLTPVVIADGFDEIAKRREARLAGANVSGSSVRRVRQRRS